MHVSRCKGEKCFTCTLYEFKLDVYTSASKPTPENMRKTGKVTYPLRISQGHPSYMELGNSYNVNNIFFNIRTDYFPETAHAESVSFPLIPHQFTNTLLRASLSIVRHTFVVGGFIICL